MFFSIDIPIQESGSQTQPTVPASTDQSIPGTSTAGPSTTASNPICSLNARPGSMVRVPELSAAASSSSTVVAPSVLGTTTSSVPVTTARHSSGHSRNSSWDLRLSYSGNGSSKNSQVFQSFF